MNTRLLDQIRPKDAPPLVRDKNVAIAPQETIVTFEEAHFNASGNLRVGQVMQGAVNAYTGKFLFLLLTAVICFTLWWVTFYAFSGTRSTNLIMPLFFSWRDDIGAKATFHCIAAIALIAFLKGQSLPQSEIAKQSLLAVFPCILMVLLFTLLQSIGFLLFLVPGLMIATVTAVIIPAYVSGDRDNLRSRVKSWDLVRGQGWRVFSVVALLGAISILLDFLMTLGALQLRGQPVEEFFNGLGFILFEPVRISVVSSLYVALHTLKYGQGENEIKKVFE